LSAAAATREQEYEEILGYHLEQAHQYLAELGPVDDRGRALARRAATMLASAGQRALGRSDMAAGANLVRRAVTLLPERDPDRIRLLPDLAEAMVETGEFAWGEVYVDEAIEAATALGDETLLADAILTRLLVRHHATEDFDAWRAEVERTAENVIPELEARGADAQLAKAWRTLAFTYANALRWEETATAQQRAIAHARKAGLTRQEARTAAAYTMSLVDGPTPVPEAIVQCEEILARGFVDRQAEVVARSSLATLLALSGEFDSAREACRIGSELQRELGAAALAVLSSLTLARIELIAGRPAAVEGELREHDAALAAIGERYYRPILVASLAQVVYFQGRRGEAEELAAIALELAPLDDVEPQAVARGVRARCLADAGQHEEARRIAEEAVTFLEATDAPFMQFQGLVDLAAVHRAAGDGASARLALERAQDRATRKAMSAPAATVRTLLDALDAELRETAPAA
jgi:tetratricopeptide (TPR) repeat protein